MQGNARNIQLDVLRCFAIVGVLTVHTVLFKKPTWDKVFVNNGWLGVDLFFVLSGYLISGLLFSEYKKRGTISLKRFWIRRIFKIWPPLYFVILLTIPTRIIVNHFRGYHDALKQVTSDVFFMQSYFPGTWGHFWSLSVEEHFYVLLPLTLWLMLRRARQGDSDPFRWLPGVFVIVAVAELAARLITAEFLDPPYQWIIFRSHLRMDSLLFGVVISYYSHFHSEGFERFARKGYWVLLGAACALFAIPRAPGVPERWRYTYGFTLIYLSFGAFLVVALHTPVERAWPPVRRALAALAYVGTFSYSIYLWHVAWLETITYFGIIKVPVLGLGSYYAGAVIVGIVASKVVETPALRIRDRLFPSRGTAVEAEPVERTVFVALQPDQPALDIPGTRT